MSLDNIKRKVAEYYKIKVADLMSKRRNRSVARPRQVAMAIAKELPSTAFLKLEMLLVVEITRQCCMLVVK